MTDSFALKELTVELTRRCFQNCMHCSSFAGKDSTRLLTRAEVDKISNEFCELDGKSISLSGGEPLIYEGIFELIQSLKSKGLTVELFTCGKIVENNVSDNNLDSVVESLKNSGVDKIVFSLQGSTAEMHGIIARTRESYSQAVRLIMKLVNDGMNVGLHVVPMRLNFDDFRVIVNNAVELGIREVGVLRFVPQGRGEEYKDILQLNPEESARLIELLAELKKRRDVDVKPGSHLDFTFFIDGSRPKECMAGKEKCYIEANGDVIPCAVFKGMSSYVAGNIKKESLIEIWNNADVFQIFRDFEPSMLKGCCQTCPKLSICRGRCPGQRVYDSDDFYQGPDSYCPKEVYERNKPRNKGVNVE